MKICPTCNTQLEDNAIFCRNCGTRVSGQPGDGNPNQFQGVYQTPYQQPIPNPYDHTSEFDSNDISENKVLAMLVYLMGIVGIVIALLAGRDSAYTHFHVRQALKFSVVDALLAIVAVLLSWTFIVPLAAGCMFIVLVIVRIISFFQICSGKAVEPAIIRSLKFMK